MDNYRPISILPAFSKIEKVVYEQLCFQYVHYDNVKSELQEVKFGVPQGSILGPLMFLIQLNDLIKKVNGCNVQMYADDTVIYTAHRDIRL